MMEKKSGGGGGGKPPPSSKKNAGGKAADPRTLFVRFHPPSATVTRQHLSDHFSNYGPVNRCSVIRRKRSKSNERIAAADGDADGGDGDDAADYDRGSKGYGFVRFVHEEDAKSAADAISKKMNRRGKKRGGGGGGGGDEGEIMVADGARYRIHAERAVDAAAATASAGSARKKRKEGGGDANVAAEGEESAAPSRSESAADATAGPETSKEEDAAAADFKAEAKRKRTSRVILRNLSFYANERHIQAAMEAEFGPVAAVDLPSVPDLPGGDDDGDDKQRQRQRAGKKKRNSVPRHRGFAFVTFQKAGDAKRAVERGNAQVKIKGRAVAIDFSVSKAEHKRMAKEAEKNKGEESDSSDSESDSGSDDDDDDDEEKDKGSEGSDNDSDDDGSSDSSDDSDEDSDSEGESDDEKEESKKKKEVENEEAAEKEKEPPKFDETEATRTLFLRNVPFDAKRRDLFELFKQFGRIEAAYLVKDKRTGAFKGTAFVRFEREEGCVAAMEASGGERDEGGTFVSSKNMAMGLGNAVGETSGLTLNGRRILVDLAVDRTTASSLAVQRDSDGKPIRKAIGKDRRNLYLKNEGRVSSAADSAHAREAGARGGAWEDLPPGDRARRERAFADKSTKLRSPLFFINPNRISVRNLAKHVTEAELKKLVFDALKKGLEDGLVTPKDAVAHWRAGGELPHAEVARRATDPNLVTPPLDEKNVREAIPSVYIDRDTSGGRKAADAPSRGFGFVEFAHHAHALAALRQLNNNHAYSREFAAGGKHAAEMLKQKRGKKGGKAKGAAAADGETTGAEFLGEDGRVCVPRLIVEFTAENKVKARQQAEKIAQKKANKIKQRIEKKEKRQSEASAGGGDEKEKKKGRGALQREKKRARKEEADAADDDDDDGTKEGKGRKKQKSEDENRAATEKPKERKAKKAKPPKKRKADREEEALEDMIRSYKSSFSEGAVGSEALAGEERQEKKEKSREDIVQKRWFE